MTRYRFITRLREVTGLDRAIFFSVMGRAWTAVGGITTILLIARFLSRDEQGYYYTFASLAAAQIVFELGFAFVIMQLAAHEQIHIARLSDGAFEAGSRSYSRLASVLQQAVRWYSWAALFMAVTLIVLGFVFFSFGHGAPGIAWKAPWVCVVLFSSITFQVDPVIAFLEGCGQVVEVGKLRLKQAVLGNILSWSAMLLHKGMFAPAALIAGQAIMGYFFLRHHRHILWPLFQFRSPNHQRVEWFTEIWPFQWRIAVSWASSYLILQLMNPVLFHYRGAIEAGRMGMSLSICNALGTLALSWVTTKATPFGTLIAKRRFKELDTLYFRALWQSTLLLLVGSALLFIGVIVAGQAVPKIANRILPPHLFVLLLASVICTHIVVSQAYYLRAHKREPFLLFWVILAVFAVGGMAIFTRVWGLTGTTVSYFVVAGLLRVSAGTYVFVRKRKEWHSDCVLLEQDAGSRPASMEPAST